MSTGTDAPEHGGDPARELVAVGRVGPAHGVNGGVFVEPWTDVPDERFLPGAVFTTAPAAAGPLTVADTGISRNRLVVQFAGIDDRAAAEALRATTLFVAAADRPALDDPDEFYDTDLVGLAVRTVDGRDLGPVRDVQHSAGADYLVVRLDGRDRLIPFVSAIVPRVDLETGVVVDPPDGLFEV